MCFTKEGYVFVRDDGNESGNVALYKYYFLQFHYKKFEITPSEFEERGYVWNDSVFFMLDTWLSQQHIGHFAYRMAHYFSISRTRKSYGIHDKLDGLFFLQINSRLPQWQANFLPLILKGDAWLTDDYTLKWTTDFEGSKTFCFRKGYLSTLHEIYFSPNQVSIWRENLYQQLGFPNPKQTCPDKKILFIDRQDRGLKNHDQIVRETVKYLQSRYGDNRFQVETVEVSGQVSFEAQARLFASAAVIISPHSSQLANLLFSSPNSVLLEHMALEDNHVFGNLAKVMGMHYERVFANATLKTDALRHRLLSKRYEICKMVLHVPLESVKSTKCWKNHSWRYLSRIRRTLDVNVFLHHLKNAMDFVDRNCNI
jgi:hypothetical protein